jgi:hypothetical protein
MRRVEQRLQRLALCAAVVAALGVGGCSDDDGGGSSDMSTATCCVTLDAPGGLLIAAGAAPDGAARYDLMLDGVSESAVTFTDRPVRDAALKPVDDLIAEWESSGFAATPPPALLTVRDEAGGIYIEAFFLREPRRDAGGALHFTADSADGTTNIPVEFVDVDVFIEPSSSDDSGRIFPFPAARYDPRNPGSAGRGRSRSTR